MFGPIDSTSGPVLLYWPGYGRRSLAHGSFGSPPLRYSFQFFTFCGASTRALMPSSLVGYRPLSISNMSSAPSMFRTVLWQP
jgi:hypothetical protein